MPFGFIVPKHVLHCLASQSFGFEHTRLRLFQKRAVCTKLDIYVLFYYRVSTSICYIYIKCDNRSTVDYDVLNNIGVLNIENRVKHKTAFGAPGTG
jgi:hypothetical protein